MSEHHVVIPGETVDYVYGPYPTAADAAHVEQRLRAQFAREQRHPAFSWGWQQDAGEGMNQHATERTVTVRQRKAGQLALDWEAR